MKNHTYKAHISTIIAFLSIGILSFFFVPTHDDLISLSCQKFSEAFHESLFCGNGRLLGNTFVKVFLNNTIADSIFRTVCIGGTVVLSAILIKGYRANGILLSAFLYLGIGLPIFKQVFVWGHGFYNYVPPVFLLILTLCLLKWFHQAENCKWRGMIIPVIFVIIFSAQLFAENSTTINLLIMACVLLWTVVKKKQKIGAITAVLGSVMGALLMFLGPTFLGVAGKMDEYRSTSSSLSGLIVTAARNAFEIVNTLSASWGLWLALSVIVLLWAGKNKKQIHWLWKTVLIGFLPFSVFQNFVVRGVFKAAIDLIFAAYILCAVIMLFKLLDKKTRNIIVIALGLAVVSAAQLLVVSPIGPRCLMITYSLLAIGLLYLFRDIQEEKGRPLLVTYRVFAVLGCAVYAVMLMAYIQCMNVHNVRMTYAQKQLEEGKTHIEIVELPYEALFHCPNDSYVYSYTFNHGDREEMTFEYITYAQYCEKIT